MGRRQAATARPTCTAPLRCAGDGGGGGGLGCRPVWLPHVLHQVHHRHCGRRPASAGARRRTRGGGGGGGGSTEMLQMGRRHACNACPVCCRFVRQPSRSFVTLFPLLLWRRTSSWRTCTSLQMRCSGWSLRWWTSSPASACRTSDRASLQPAVPPACLLHTLPDTDFFKEAHTCPPPTPPPFETAPPLPSQFDTRAALVMLSMRADALEEASVPWGAVGGLLDP